MTRASCAVKSSAASKSRDLTREARDSTDVTSFGAAKPTPEPRTGVFFPPPTVNKLDSLVLFPKFSSVSLPFPLGRSEGDDPGTNPANARATTQCGGSKLFVAHRDNPICSCQSPSRPRFYRRSRLFLRHRRERFRMIDPLHPAGWRLTRESASGGARLNFSRRICAVGLSMHKWNIRSAGRRPPQFPL